MSWSAHDLEPYVIQRHLGRRIAFAPLLLGSYSPDLATKWLVYGISVGGLELRADDPVQFHRGWPGMGFTHSLAFGVAVALLVFLVFRSRIWAVSFCVGQWAHALSDVTDTAGSMLLFPLTTERFSIDAWRYAAHLDRLADAAAYFSSLGFVWDGLWVALALLSWRVLTRSYFLENVVVADPLWRRLGRALPERALLALYRASFFYGTTRWVAWLLWAHVLNDYQFDLDWGGPSWVPPLPER